MKHIVTISELPDVPAIYALYGGQGRAMYIAYVGLARQLKTRIIQHLVRRDSSVTTGVQAVSLNPDLVVKVSWWEHADFVSSSILTAAELVAFDVLDPVLRSRGTVSGEARSLYKDEEFQLRMRELFQEDASGCFMVPNLQSAFERILALETRLAELEQRIDKL